ncbi:DUF2637 domain-containing protein [Amycolatopsis sp. lyj-84]|uniref:DUF2637 domain-containing protein n=1 Tax=Amycolatopsis sp. lyj-84 TaxID=2789284 RepID=UPI00397A9CF9
MAIGAAYASYRHGREFALQFGADPATAAIWPLIVDGLLMIATVELWKPSDHEHARGRWTAWLAFAFGISLSLCANIASAPVSSAFGVAVAACPPLALLLAVELLNRALKRHRTSTPETSTNTSLEQESAPSLATPLPEALSASTSELTAEQRMWNFYISEQQRGRTPSGADLDRLAGTHNYGRRILRKWRTKGTEHLLESGDKHEPVRREAAHPA